MPTLLRTFSGYFKFNGGNDSYDVMYVIRCVVALIVMHAIVITLIRRVKILTVIQDIVIIRTPRSDHLKV